uniref:ATP synthase complex subunit 8 n=1 Tax=Chrysomelidae sp. SOIL MMG Contig15 TaxID=2834637 RepID=A0A8F4WHN0_9CUCU|nr:ATP synthase F0 subunit 8 [Chrysomelidae sp. SOIL MMG Contig15]
MPQMAPINWLTLFCLFSIYMLIFSSMNYFFFLKSPKKSLTTKSKSQQNWSW